MNWREWLRAIEPHPRKNFSVKALALGLSILLWGFVHSEESVPTIQSAPVELENLPANLAVAQEYDETVTVWIRGPERRVRDLSGGQISPRIDLSQARPGENIIPLSRSDIRVPVGLEVARIEPNEITLVLDEKVDRLVEINPVVAGEPAPGYEVVGKRLEPVSVWVSGPRRRVEQLENLNTQTVDVSNRTESFSQIVPVRSPDPFIDFTSETERSVRLTITVVEQATTAQYDSIPVSVVNSSHRVDVNPRVIGVVLRGPPSVLNDFAPQQLRAVIDAADLAPRREDYMISPTIIVEPEALSEVLEVIAITPQRRINVHVYDTPGGRR